MHNRYEPHRQKSSRRKWRGWRETHFPVEMPRCSGQPILCTGNCWNRCSACAKRAGDGNQNGRRIEEEGLKKQEENKILKTGMCARIDEWLKKKRKSARRMVQNDMATLKQEIRQMKPCAAEVPFLMSPARPWENV